MPRPPVSWSGLQRAAVEGAAALPAPSGLVRRRETSEIPRGGGAVPWSGGLRGAGLPIRGTRDRARSGAGRDEKSAAPVGEQGIGTSRRVDLAPV